jgi:hypothetical protein
MWDLVKVELGNKKKATKNTEISENGANTQDQKAIANVFNEYYTSIAKKILSGNPLLNTNEINVNTVKYNSI